MIKFSYGDLVDSNTELINSDYWKSITNDYRLTEVAVLVSPGMREGVEFDGSGIYEIRSVAT